MLSKKTDLDGFAGIAFRYKVVETKQIALFGGFTAMLLTSSDVEVPNTILWNPNVSAEFDLFDSAFRPYLGVGYNFFRKKYNTTFLSAYNPNYSAPHTFKYNFSGFNVNPGINYYVNDRMFAYAGYNFVSGNFDSPGNTNFHFLILGLGATF